MTIEYSNHLGETTRTNLASYLYTETQEEYILDGTMNTIMPKEDYLKLFDAQIRNLIFLYV